MTTLKGTLIFIAGLLGFVGSCGGNLYIWQVLLSWLITGLIIALILHMEVVDRFGYNKAMEHAEQKHIYNPANKTTHT